MSIAVSVDEFEGTETGLSSSLPPYSIKEWPEWDLKPFIEIKIEKSLKTGCEPGWEPLFFKEWGGQ